MRGEGEGSQLEAELPERGCDIALGSAFSEANAEKRGAVAGREVSESFVSDFWMTMEG